MRPSSADQLSYGTTEGNPCLKNPGVSQHIIRICILRVVFDSELPRGRGRLNKPLWDFPTGSSIRR